MHNTFPSLRLAIATLLLVPATVSAQIVAGKTNNFEDGTTQGWRINALVFGGLPAAAAAPTNVATGGPAGANDNYLRLTSLGGAGSASRMTALNTGWGGNWLAAGITTVRFDAINFGNSDLSLRLLMEDPVAGPPTNIAISATGMFLASGSGWQTLEFDLFGPDGLISLLGSVNGALSNTTVFRIFHSASPVFPGDPLAATLGIDNIAAVGTVVPEPSSIVLFAAGALTLLMLRRRRIG